MSGGNVIEIVGRGQFSKDVVKASESMLVVVDFWASWCGPCRMLAPILDKVVESFGGKVRLAKVNTEEPENEALAMEYNIRGIPAVKFFRGGRVVGEFVGVQPEWHVRKLIQSVLPTEKDNLVARARKLLGEGKAEEAEPLLRKALESDARDPGACLELAKILLARNNLDDARELLIRISVQDEKEYREAEGLLAQLEFISHCRMAGNRSEVMKKLAAEPDNMEWKMGAANCLVAEGKYREAMEEYLAVMQRDKKFHDEAPRKMMLRVFAIVGPRSALADEYRDRMAKLLYS